MSQPKYTPLDEHENEGNLFSTNVSDFDSPMKHGHTHSFFKTKTFKILLVVAAILTLVLVAAIVFILTKTNSSHDHKFNLSPSWDADFVTQKIEVLPGTWANLTGHVYMDAALNSRFRFDMESVISVIFKSQKMFVIKKLPTCKYNESTYPINDSLKLNFTYDNMYSTYVDAKGKSADCDLFSSQDLAGGSITLCLANDEILAFARFNLPPISTNPSNSTFMLYYKNFQAWNQTEDHDSLFEVPDGCILDKNKTIGGGDENKRSFEASSFVLPILSHFKL